MDQIPQDELISAYLDGELNAEERATVERLLADSAEARQLLEELRTLAAGLRALPLMKVEPDFCERILRRAEQEKQLLSQAEESPAATVAERNGDRPVPSGHANERGGLADDGQLPWQKRVARMLFWPALATAAALAIMYLDPDRAARDGGRPVAVNTPQDLRGEADRVENLRRGGAAAKPAGSADSFISAAPDSSRMEANKRKAVAASDFAEESNNAIGQKDSVGLDRKAAGFSDGLFDADTDAAGAPANRMNESLGDASYRQLAFLPIESEVEIVVPAETDNSVALAQLFARADIHYRFSDQESSALGVEWDKVGGMGGGAPGGGLGGGPGATREEPVEPAADFPPPAPAAPPQPPAPSDEPAPSAAVPLAATLEDAMPEDAASFNYMNSNEQFTVEIIATPEQVERLVETARSAPELFLAVNPRAANLRTMEELRRSEMDQREQAETRDEALEQSGTTAAPSAGDAPLADAPAAGAPAEEAAAEGGPAGGGRGAAVEDGNKLAGIRAKSDKQLRQFDKQKKNGASRTEEFDRPTDGVAFGRQGQESSPVLVRVLQRNAVQDQAESSMDAKAGERLGEAESAASRRAGNNDVAKKAPAAVQPPAALKGQAAGAGGVDRSAKGPAKDEQEKSTRSERKRRSTTLAAEKENRLPKSTSTTQPAAEPESLQARDSEEYRWHEGDPTAGKVRVILLFRAAQPAATREAAPAGTPAEPQP